MTKETNSHVGGSVELGRAVRYKYTSGFRLLVSILGGLMVGTVFYRLGVGFVAWLVLVAWTVVWPLAEWWMLRRAATGRVRVQERCLLGEVAAGGAFVTLMQFNLLLSVLVVVACVSAAIALYGRRLLLRTFVMVLLGSAVAAAFGGVAFSPWADGPEILASVPMVFVLPLALAWVTRSLVQRMHAQIQELNRMNHIDSLCGLLNRGCWEERVNAKMSGPADGGVILLLDIDQFKQVNDTCGHITGDEVIAKVGAIIEADTREGDIAGRYGGDEFAIVLDAADVMIAKVVAERIRRAVASASIDAAPQLRCTLSIGIASYAAQMHDARDWVKAADAALYRAKRAGRDRSMVAGWPPSLVADDEDGQMATGPYALASNPEAF